MHFLCLHGKGTNSKIFEMQTAAIRFELGDHHTYEFLEGVLPCPIDPELQNFSTGDSECFQYFDSSSQASYRQAVEQLNSFIATEGPFDGLFAFSQGAAIAATLLAQSYHRQNSPPPLNNATPFKCAIFFSAIRPVDYSRLIQGEVHMLNATADGDFLELPTVHVWGLKDSAWSADSEALSNLCAASNRVVYIHEGGHEVPGPRLSDSVTEIVKAIRRTVDRALTSQ